MLSVFELEDNCLLCIYKSRNFPVQQFLTDYDYIIIKKWQFVLLSLHLLGNLFFRDLNTNAIAYLPDGVFANLTKVYSM